MQGEASDDIWMLSWLCTPLHDHLSDAPHSPYGMHQMILGQKNEYLQSDWLAWKQDC